MLAQTHRSPSTREQACTALDPALRIDDRSLRFVSCDAANADQLCRTGSVCARPALTSRAQTQSAVLPRSCSNRSCRLLARASVLLTHAQRVRALKVLVPPGSRQPLRPRLQHGRCCAYTATPFYSILYSKNAAVYAYTADAPCPARFVALYSVYSALQRIQPYSVTLYIPIHPTSVTPMCHESRRMKSNGSCFVS